VQQFGDSSASRASTDHHDFAVGQIFASNLGGVDQPRQNHYCRAMLVVVKHRNV